VSPASPAGRRPDSAGTRPSRSDAHPLNWLLAVPIVACLITPAFNRVEPRLFSIPFFYWYQMAIIPVGVVCTVLAYRAARRPGRPPGDAAAGPTEPGPR
jgi:Protein of unknown function (DUF3311)